MGKVIFEGEWKEGKRWNGEGKEYNQEDLLVNEKAYENGDIKSEKKRSYNYFNELINVKEYFKGILIYDGNYKYEKKMANQKNIINKVN